MAKQDTTNRTRAKVKNTAKLRVTKDLVSEKPVFK